MDRKQLLKGVDAWDGQLRCSDHQAGSAETMHREACRLGLEGVICKQNVPYRAGRGGTWVKVKCLGREELVVIGWTPPGGSRSGVGSLHVGYYDRAGSCITRAVSGQDTRIANWQSGVLAWSRWQRHRRRRYSMQATR